MILVMAFFLITYTFHSTWVTSEAYSSPSIVLSARGGDGSRIIFDDFREAYYWLRHNTPEVSNTQRNKDPLNIKLWCWFIILCFQDAKVMSWWDYGYQITAMANRTILVDNNTWNNTHISRVGQVSWLTFSLIMIWTRYHVDRAAFCCLGHGIHRREGLWDHAGAGCQLCPGHLWRTDRIFIWWYVTFISRWGIDLVGAYYGEH